MSRWQTPIRLGYHGCCFVYAEVFRRETGDRDAVLAG
jgi:hypothetical protein